jgi:hypothetical protein
MNLDDAQKKQVSAWIAAGLKLSEIQTKLHSEFGIRLTYMEVRLLVDDLKLVPKDPEPPKSADLAALTGAPGSKAPTPQAPGRAREEKPKPGGPLPGGAQGVSVTVDQLAKPGALVSGSVTFSDGNKAEWYLDQLGRLGVVPKQPGYKPSPADLQEFQMELQAELGRLGF